MTAPENWEWGACFEPTGKVGFNSGNDLPCKILPNPRNEFHRRKAHQVMACARLSITGKGLASNYL
jgi:hypothetical protein